MCEALGLSKAVGRKGGRCRAGACPVVRRPLAAGSPPRPGARISGGVRIERREEHLVLDIDLESADQAVADPPDVDLARVERTAVGTDGAAGASHLDHSIARLVDDLGLDFTADVRADGGEELSESGQPTIGAAPGQSLGLGAPRSPSADRTRPVAAAANCMGTSWSPHIGPGVMVRCTASAEPSPVVLRARRAAPRRPFVRRIRRKGRPHARRGVSRFVLAAPTGAR